MQVSAFLLILGAICRVPTSLLHRGDVVLCTDIILRFGCNCKLPAIFYSTNSYCMYTPCVCPWTDTPTCNKSCREKWAHVTRPHEWSISVACKGKTLWAKKITFHKWMTCTCVVSFEITNNKRKSCLRVKTMCLFFLTFAIWLQLFFSSKNVVTLFGFFYPVLFTPACNPDCSIRMNWCDCPCFTVIQFVWFAEDTICPTSIL